MKKVSFALIIILLFNFIFCNIAYAAPNASSGDTVGEATTGTALPFNASSLYQADQEGTVEINGHTKEIGVTESVVGAILGLLISPFVLVANTVAAVLNVLATMCGYYHTDSEYGSDKDKILKVSSIIFGEYLIFDPIITNTASRLNSEIEPAALTTLFSSIKEIASAVFLVCWYLAIAMLLVVLVYTAGRLAISVKAKDMARLRSLLFDWLVGLIFIFSVRFIFIAMNWFLEAIMDAIWMWRLEMEAVGYKSFEVSVYGNLLEILEQKGGMQYCAYGLLYIVLIYNVAKFFIKYIFRVFKILLLVVSSPIVGVIYALQRAGYSNKGSEQMKTAKEYTENAIARWAGTYATLLFIQPIHAITYLVFMFTAGEIAENAPILGILFIWALARSEKIVRAIMGLKDTVDLLGKKGEASGG